VRCGERIRRGGNQGGGGERRGGERHQPDSGAGRGGGNPSWTWMRLRRLELEGALRAAAALASWRFGAVGVKARGGGLWGRTRTGL
jgi:hypothetical protein